MKSFLFLFYWCSISVVSQEIIETKLLNATEIKLQSIVGIDNFGVIYLVNDHVFHQIDQEKDMTYSNIQLGNITSANAFNSLRINLFYINFNTIVILDNRLAEIYRIDFNTIQPYKNVSHISTGYDTTIWIFNTDLQQLELFDYKTSKSRATSLPVQSVVLDMVSNYNFCWLLTKEYLYKYNYFGSMVSKIKNEGFTKLSENNGNLVIQQGGQLKYLPNASEKFLALPVNGLLINQFLLTNETLYIYDSEKLYQFQLKIR